jgi:aminopeptidase N
VQISKRRWKTRRKKICTLFFQQWLYQAGYPKLNLQWLYDQQKKELRFKLAQVQTQAQFQFPFDVAVMSHDGLIQVHHFQMNQQANEYRVPSDAIPKSLALDLYVRLLFEAKIEPR